MFEMHTDADDLHQWNSPYEKTIQVSNLNYYN